MNHHEDTLIDPEKKWLYTFSQGLSHPQLHENTNHKLQLFQGSEATESVGLRFCQKTEIISNMQCFQNKLYQKKTAEFHAQKQTHGTSLYVQLGLFRIVFLSCESFLLQQTLAILEALGCKFKYCEQLMDFHSILSVHIHSVYYQWQVTSYYFYVPFLWYFLVVEHICEFAACHAGLPWKGCLALTETDILQLAAVQGQFILSVCTGFHIERMFSQL